MSKKTSVVLLSILIVVVLFFGIVSFLPEIHYGNYKVYYSPVNLIQKGSDMGNSVVGTYAVDHTGMTAEEYAEYQNTIRSIVSKRLQKVFGYYDSNIAFEQNGQRLAVTIPETTAHDGTKAQDIMSSVMIEGYIEFTNTSSTTYNKDNVLFAIDTVDNLSSGASVSQYVQGSNRYYIVKVKLTSEGKQLVQDKLTASTSSVAAYCAVDEVLSYSVYFTSETSNTLEIYCQDTSTANMLASVFNYGYIQCDLSELDTEVVVLNTPVAMIVGFVMLAVILAFCIFAIVRYGLFGLAITLSFAIAAVVTVIFCGLAYFSVFNLYAFFGFVIGFGVMCYLTVDTFEKVRKQLIGGTKLNSAIKVGFNSGWLRMLIVNGVMLVLGIILWVIPTAVTVPMGNALVYAAVISLICNFGLNRALVLLVKSLCGDSVALLRIKA